MADEKDIKKEIEIETPEEEPETPAEETEAEAKEASEETEKAQETIHRVIASVEKTTRKRYSSNETVNMILSCCEADMAENGIDFQYTIRIPKVLPVSDVDLTSILSKALENAIHAVSSVQDPKKRIIRLSMIESGDKLLISLKNTCSAIPRFEGGMPVTTEPGHGLGTQSIDYAVRKLNGNCQFSMEGEYFVLQIVM